MEGANGQRDASRSLDSSTDKLKEIVQNLVAITDQVAVATNNSEKNVASCYATFESANAGFMTALQQVETTISNVVTSSEKYHQLAQRDDMSRSMKSMSENVEKVVNSLTR
jgi:methyl-accepting chemotaxis protein